MTNSQADLKLLSSVISGPPFNKRWSLIQLHDELSPDQLIGLAFEIAAYIDEANKPSIFSADREFEDRITRLAGFLGMLKYEPAVADIQALIPKLLNLDRDVILNAIIYLARDLANHKKRAYLALFLAIPEVPGDFSQDEVIVSLTRDIELLQDEFKTTHKYLDGMKQTGPNAAALKREIQQMEEEKQQLLSKIGKIQKKVQNVPKSDQWLEAGKNLRLEQLTGMSLAESLKEQTSQAEQVEKRYSAATESLKAVMDNLASLNAEAVFSKVEEESRMNKFLATTSLPKAVSDAEFKIADLKDIISREEINDTDIGRIEKEIVDTNQLNSQLAEQRLKSSNTGDANLALFRQQASIISAKKEGTLSQLNAVSSELTKLTKLLAEKQSQGGTGKKMLVGDDFKRYVSELRGKSTLFKRKKAEMSSLATEFGILQRTQEILKRREQDLQDSLNAAEKRQGISGYHEAQENLEKVSEMKSEKDQEKGEKLQAISEIVQHLTNSINEKKSSLAPVIQNLRTMRQEAQELQEQYDEQKKAYEATMFGVESELNQVKSEVQAASFEFRSHQGRYHQLNQLILQTEITQDRIMNEMKAYIGADEMIELVQKSRGFKSYRDLYTKKIADGENAAKILKVEQKETKMKHEPNMRQIALFSGVENLLALKMAHNQRVISGGGTDENVGVSLVTQDRMVLS